MPTQQSASGYRDTLMVRLFRARVISCHREDASSHCGDLEHGRAVALEVKFANFRQITQSRTGQMQIRPRSELEQLGNALLQPLFPVTKGVRLLVFARGGRSRARAPIQPARLAAQSLASLDPPVASDTRTHRPAAHPLRRERRAVGALMSWSTMAIV